MFIYNCSIGQVTNVPFSQQLTIFTPKVHDTRSMHAILLFFPTLPHCMITIQLLYSASILYGIPTILSQPSCSHNISVVSRAVCLSLGLQGINYARTDYAPKCIAELSIGHQILALAPPILPKLKLWDSTHVVTTSLLASYALFHPSLLFSTSLYLSSPSTTVLPRSQPSSTTLNDPPRPSRVLYYLLRLFVVLHDSRPASTVSHLPVPSCAAAGQPPGPCRCPGSVLGGRFPFDQDIG